VIYFDTSYIVKCYLNETGSTEVRALAQSVSGLSSCLHGRAEFWTAVKRNVRENLITAAEATATYERFKEDEAAGVWRWFPIERSLMELTCRRVESAPETIFLRAADTLHLACAEDQGFTEIYSHDKHVLAAAPVFGLIGKDVIAPAQPSTSP
jgi:predicted nucleic acid-binding protein